MKFGFLRCVVEPNCHQLTMSNPFQALATLTDSEDETIPQTTPERSTEPVPPLAPKKAAKKRPVKVALSELLSSSPQRQRPHQRPHQRPRQVNDKKGGVTYRRNKAGQLVAPSGAIAGRAASASASSRRVSFKGGDFPSLGAVSATVVTGTWSSGIDRVVAAKDLPDPAIAFRKEAELRRAFLVRQRAAAQSQGYVDYSDDEEFSDEQELTDHDRAIASAVIARSEVEEAAAMASIVEKRGDERDDLSGWEAERGQGWSHAVSGSGSGWDDWE